MQFFIKQGKALHLCDSLPKCLRVPNIIHSTKQNSVCFINEGVVFILKLPLLSQLIARPFFLVFTQARLNLLNKILTYERGPRLVLPLNSIYLELGHACFAEMKESLSCLHIWDKMYPVHHCGYQSSHNEYLVLCDSPVITQRKHQICAIFVEIH